MFYLGLDTTNKYIIVTLFNDEEILYFKKEIADRNASELISVFIHESMEAVGIKPAELSAVVVTRGPGSFTGVRIGLSAAKVLTSSLNIDLYSLSSMQYYSGLSGKDVMLDARSKKVYYGKYDNGNIVSEELILLEEINDFDNVIGTLSVIDKEDIFENLDTNFLKLKNVWKKESFFDAVPTYLKSNL